MPHWAVYYRVFFRRTTTAADERHANPANALYPVFAPSVEPGFGLA
ncbi:hypothetical protein ACO2Q8_03935 [Larkinella sp. VNQ87]